MNSVIINIMCGEKHYRVTCNKYETDDRYRFIVHQIIVTNTSTTKGQVTNYLGAGVRDTVQECFEAAVTTFVQLWIN